jgi:pterin-4a-carbinolamine dehydratase
MIDTEHGSLIGNLIFLSYRRSDSAAHTLALRLELETQLRAAQIFVDTHAVQGGETWPVQIEDALYLAKVVIPIIGKSWAGVDSAGRRRLDDPEDWVHKEIKIALTRKRDAIVPLLVDGAVALRYCELPDPLRELAEIQSIKIDLDQWDNDIRSVIKILKEKFEFETKTSRFKYPVRDPLKEKTIPVSWELLETEVGKGSLSEWRIEFSDDPDRLHYKRVELVREFVFETFEKAMLFMEVAAKNATENNHHPRWMNMYSTVTVWLSTWDAGHRITLLDVQLARYLERRYKDF